MLYNLHAVCKIALKINKSDKKDLLTSYRLIKNCPVIYIRQITRSVCLGAPFNYNYLILYYIKKYNILRIINEPFLFQILFYSNTLLLTMNNILFLYTISRLQAASTKKFKYHLVEFGNLPLSVQTLLKLVKNCS